MQAIKPQSEYLKTGCALSLQERRWLGENCVNVTCVIFPSTYRITFVFYKVGTDIVVVCDWPAFGKDWYRLGGTKNGHVFGVFSGTPQRMRPAWDMAAEYVTECIRQWGRENNNRQFEYHNSIKV